MKKQNHKTIKVNPKYIKEAIEEYNREMAVNEGISTNTCEINGYTYFVSELTTEEFIQQNNLRDFEDLK